VGDFGHMAFEATPIANYLDHKEDSKLEYLENVHAQVDDRQCMA